MGFLPWEKKVALTAAALRRSHCELTLANPGMLWCENTLPSRREAQQTLALFLLPSFAFRFRSSAPLPNRLNLSFTRLWAPLGPWKMKRTWRQREAPNGVVLSQLTSSFQALQLGHSSTSQVRKQDACSCSSCASATWEHPDWDPSEQV